jgi:hypothetical protein
MKKLIILLFTVFLSVGSLSAQSTDLPLLKITRGLGQNAEGFFSPYPKTQYKEDINSLTRLQDNYSFLGIKLNDSYKLLKDLA